MFKKSKTNKICIVFGAGSAKLGSGKHVVSFDMLTFWDGLQRLVNNVRGTLGMADFFNRVEGDKRTE